MKAVVVVRGGLVAEIYCDNPQAQFTVVDWDNLESAEPGQRIGFEWGETLRLHDLEEETRAQVKGMLPSQ